MEFNNKIFPLLLLLLIIGLEAQPRPIVFFDLFGYPKFIGEVVIVNYNRDSSIINFRSIEYDDTLNSATCHYPINDQLEAKSPEINALPPHILFIGDTVYVVIDQQNNVAFFAKKFSKNYIMFSGYVFEGICSFEIGKSSVESDTSTSTNNTASIYTYWHPCLLKDSQFTKIVSNYKSAVPFIERMSNIEEFKDKQLLYVFFEDTLYIFHDYLWTKCIKKKVSLILKRLNGKPLELVLNCTNINIDMFKAKTPFDMEFFKKMHVISIGWK